VTTPVCCDFFSADRDVRDFYRIAIIGYFRPSTRLGHYPHDRLQAIINIGVVTNVLRTKACRCRSSVMAGQTCLIMLDQRGTAARASPRRARVSPPERPLNRRELPPHRRPDRKARKQRPGLPSHAVAPVSHLFPGLAVRAN